MRTTVDLDARLVRKAAAVTGARTKKELLHCGLREIIRRQQASELLDLIGRPLLRMTPRQFLKWRRRG